MHGTRHWPPSCSFAYGCILAPFEHFCWREMQKRMRTAPASVSEPAAPRCDVTASQPTLSETGPNRPVSFFPQDRDSYKGQGSYQNRDSYQGIALAMPQILRNRLPL